MDGILDGANYPHARWSVVVSRRYLWPSTVKERRIAVNGPPEGLPRYRLLTGSDEAAFCHIVSRALDAGYALYGSPAVAVDGDRTIVAQVVLCP